MLQNMNIDLLYIFNIKCSRKILEGENRVQNNLVVSGLPEVFLTISLMIKGTN